MTFFPSSVKLDSFAFQLSTAIMNLPDQSNLTTLNIAGYQFLPLANLAELRAKLLAAGNASGLKGTILLSEEGINLFLAGEPAKIRAFQQRLREEGLMIGQHFHESYSKTPPFRFFKVKIKKEIITFKRPDIDMASSRAPAIAPEELKAWLDAEKDFVLLDTRNNYEVPFGTFKNALTLPIDDFSALPEVLPDLDQNKAIVMFCTGGIRCEKAALYLQAENYPNVYQLDGGILGYFAKVGGEHYQGDCFVFDERIAVTPTLKPAEISADMEKYI